MTDLILRIKRTFTDISDEVLADIERAQVFSHMGLSGPVDWTQLLKSPRILIVAEAGSGKTHECQQEKKRLWDAGEPAFFLELAQLVQSNLRTQLSPEEEDRFDVWRTSQSGSATFFLDSFDELKLTQLSFRQALIHLEKELVRQLDRVRVVITTRPIPFDEEQFRQRLPVSAPSHEMEELPIEQAQAFADIATKKARSRPIREKANEAPVWRRVYLMPLTSPLNQKNRTGYGGTDRHTST